MAYADVQPKMELSTREKWQGALLGIADAFSPNGGDDQSKFLSRKQEEFNTYQKLKKDATDWQTNAQAQITMRLAAARGIDPTNPDGSLKEQPKLLSEISGSQKNIVTIDPISGEQMSSFNSPYNTIVRKGVMSPEQMKERAVATGEGKAIEKDIEQVSKLGTAVKRLAIINKQFNEALPSGDRTPLEQRIYGNVENAKVKYGFSDNKKLLALQQNIRPIAINMIRAFGEVGNLSESEQQGAIDVVNSAGLTDQERLEKTRQFIEFALAGARPESIKMISERKDVQGIIDSFGVDLGNSTVQSNVPFKVGEDYNGHKILSVKKVK